MQINELLFNLGLLFILNSNWKDSLWAPPEQIFVFLLPTTLVSNRTFICETISRQPIVHQYSIITIYPYN